MICPHCQRTIREEDRDLMAVDPDAPGIVDLFRAWLTGERSVMAAIAVIGSSAIAAFLIVGVAQLAQHL